LKLAEKNTLYIYKLATAGVKTAVLPSLEVAEASETAIGWIGCSTLEAKFGGIMAVATLHW